MDPEKQLSHGDYRLSTTQRRFLLNSGHVDPDESKQTTEIARRAKHLDARFQHLFEDIHLLYYCWILDSIIPMRSKVKLEEIEPILDHEIDQPLIEHEIEQSNVSTFGIALGKMLSQVYPGDPTEQTRLWWGLVLGYFGHPALEHDRPERIPQSILGTISRKYSEKEDLDNFALAESQANWVVEQFGRELLYEFSEGVTVTTPEDLPKVLQVLVVASGKQGGDVTRRGLRNAYLHDLDRDEDQEDKTLLELVYRDAFGDQYSNIVEQLVKSRIDSELLTEADQLNRWLIADVARVSEQEFNNTYAHDVFKALWDAEAPQTAEALGSELGEPANLVKKLLNDFADQGTSKREWKGPIPATESPDGFQLTPYGELLGYALFESENYLSQVYAVALDERYHDLFKVPEHLRALVLAITGYEPKT